MGEITYRYRQQRVFCRAEANCQTCCAGIGHGPYWYKYEEANGRTVRTYIGKRLPPGVSSPHESENPTAFLRVFALGQFHLERRVRGQRWQTIPESAWSEPNARRILAYLMSIPGRKAHHAQVKEALWPDADAATADALLVRGVEALRQVIEPSRRYQGSGFLLRREGGWFVLADQQELWVDADAFEMQFDSATAEQLAKALHLYGGDYLPEERKTAWAVARRQALRHRWIGLLLDLANQHNDQGNTSGAISLLDRLLAIDPANEAAMQLLLIALGQEHRRGEALRTYQRFTTVLSREYGVGPAEETRLLYEILQRGDYKVFPREMVRRSMARRNDFSFASQARLGGATGNPSGLLSAGRSHQHVLVGREDERGVLRTLMESVERPAGHPPADDGQEGKPRCAFLLGEAGIGKTRLAEELAREAQEHSWVIAWGHTYTQESSIPYRPWIEACHMALAQQNQWVSRVVAKRALAFQPLLALLPELYELLPEVIGSSTLAEQEQLRLWEAIRALLATISESTTLLIVLDDLQWADNSSCELLAYLVRGLREQSVMIVGTCRESELPAHHPLRAVLVDLQREQAVETLTIQRLTDEQIRALISHLPEPVVGYIQTHAAGNPFFAEELARGIEASHLVAAQQAAPGAGTPRQIAGTTDSLQFPTTLPDTISAVLDLRLGRLSPACQRLLVHAAVLGGSFEFNIIRAMEAVGSPDANEDVLLDLLEEALQSGMLTEEGSGTRITYHFWHPLLVSHLSQVISAGRRASLHRRAAEVLRRAYQGREEEGATAIAYHLASGGGDATQIAYYAGLAGDRAYRLPAYPEAERQYRLALEQKGALPAQASREEWLQRATLLERLGECTRIQGNDQEARRYFEQALDARSRHRLPVSSSDGHDELQLDALLWCQLGKTWFDTGEYMRAQQCYRQAEQVLREAGVETGPAWANLHLEQGYIHWKMGKFEEARQAALLALETFGQGLGGRKLAAFHSTATRRTLEGDPVDLGRTHRLLAAIALTEGDGPGALKHLTLALRIFERYDRQREIAWVCDNLGDFYLRDAHYQQAQAYLRRSIGIAERIGDTPLRAGGRANLGALAARLGDLADAEASLRRAIELAERIGDPVYQTLWESFLAFVLHAQGKNEEAVAMMCRALALSRTLHIPSCTGFALSLLGQMRLAQAGANELNPPRGDNRLRSRTLLRARVAFRRALAYEGLEAETITETHVALAEVSWYLGEVEEARQQALEAVEEARRYKLSWLLARAQRLIGSILAGQKEFGQAAVYFEQAVLFFRERGMRLEWARTLQGYGGMLLQADSDQNREQGIRFLEEAQQIYAACRATFDHQMLERTWGKYLQDGTP